MLTTPDFDVRETASAYFLEGNFAGIGTTSDIKMEWVGGRTLVIDVHISKMDLKEVWGVDVDAEQDQKKEDEDHTPVGTCHYQRIQAPPMDEKQYIECSQADAEPQREHRYSHRHDDKEVRSQDWEMEHQNREALSAVREWLSERHLGDMQRSFTFPRDISVRDVKAKLKNGLLMIMVPKVHKTEVRYKVDIVTED